MVTDFIKVDTSAGDEEEASQPYALGELSCDFLRFGGEEPLLLVAQEVETYANGYLVPDNSVLRWYEG